MKLPNGKFVMVTAEGFYHGKYHRTVNIADIVIWNDIKNARSFHKFIMNNDKDYTVVSTDVINHQSALLRTHNCMWATWDNVKCFIEPMG